MDNNKAGGFEKGIKKMSNILMYMGTSMLLVMMFFGTADVIGRYLFNSPIIGTIEVFEILLPIISLLGLAYTQKEKGHIRVDLLYSRFPRRPQAVIGLGITIWSILLFILIAWQGTLTAISYREQERLISNIHIPIYLIQLLVPLGAVALCLVLIIDLIHFVIDIRKAE